MPGIYIMFNLPSRIERIKLAAYTGSPAPPIPKERVHENGGRQYAGHPTEPGAGRQRLGFDTAKDHRLLNHQPLARRGNLPERVHN